MGSLARKVAVFVKSEQGPTTVEYAIMLGFIAAACLATITELGNSSNTTFNTAANSLGAMASEP